MRKAEKAGNTEVATAFLAFLEDFERVLGRRLTDEEGAELRKSEDVRVLAEYADRGLNKEGMGLIASAGVAPYAIGKIINGLLSDCIQLGIGVMLETVD